MVRSAARSPASAQRRPHGSPGDRAIALSLAAAAIVLYLVSAIGHGTPYDYFARLAQAFVAGRWWLDAPPSWLNELLPCGEGRYCAVYPPLPALAVLPFLAVLGDGAAQTTASAVAGGLSAAPAYLALRRLGAPWRVALATTVFSFAGTTLWFTASDGRAWYIAHSVALLLASLAVLAAVEGRPAWLVGAAIGAAALARPSVGLAALGLALIVARRRRQPLPRVLLVGAIGVAPFALALALYDQLRFGSPLDMGYARLALGDPFFADGLFSLAHVPRHLYAIVIQAPEFVEGSGPPFVRPNWIGVSLLLTSPAFVYVFAALAARGRDEMLPLALATFLPLAMIVTYGTFGFAQFGYRYSLDLQPFLLPLTAIGACWRDGSWIAPRWTYLATIAWSVVANLYGIVAITFLGYVS